MKLLIQITSFFTLIFIHATAFASYELNMEDRPNLPYAHRTTPSSVSSAEEEIINLPPLISPSSESSSEVDDNNFSKKCQCGTLIYGITTSVIMSTLFGGVIGGAMTQMTPYGGAFFGGFIGLTSVHDTF